jgi:hypothetical protein
MDFNDPNHRRNSSPPQVIPLQDLTQQGTAQDEDADRQQAGGRARAISDLVRNRLSGGRGPRGTFGGTYAPIAEADPDRGRRPTGALLAIPQNTSGSYGGQDASPTSPVDAAGFQAAIGGFAGLSFSTPTPIEPTSSGWLHNNGSTASLVTLPEGGPSTENTGDYFSGPSSSSDRTPLTDPHHLQPIAGSSVPTTPSPNRNSRTRSVRFSNVPITPNSRLGDDLAQAEAGMSGSGIRRSGSLRRSLSPSAAGSTLQRAGTIVRNMSTRIVNLSNEQDVVDRTIRRSTSNKGDRPDSTQSTVPGDVSMVDGNTDDDGGRVEKTPSVEETETISRRSSRTTRENNPLKGKSLGIFSPDNRIRMKLCDLLVHPVTEPTIFILIVLQAILLSIDSSRNIVYDDNKAFRWGATWIDYVLMVLFSIYTAEIVIRSIVSGFLINPLEYSTINRQIGTGRAMLDKARDVFGSTAQNRPGHVGTNDSTFDPHHPSVMRSFTTNIQDSADTKGGSRYQQRARLAHRAFLRHSFNRVDLIAVVSYWISFVLSVFELESNKHVFVFRMLSCLRILRLLYLTSGTTVCYFPQVNNRFM